MTQTTNSTATRTADTLQTYDRERAALVRQLGPLGLLLAWLDRHPTIANIIIGIMALALAYAVFTYEFTIPAYQ